jgi:hypothetical protein
MTLTSVNFSNQMRLVSTAPFHDLSRPRRAPFRGGRLRRFAQMLLIGMRVIKRSLDGIVDALEPHEAYPPSRTGSTLGWKNWRCSRSA